MIGNDWDIILNDEFNKDYYKKLISFIDDEYNNKIIYPDKINVFNALKLTSYEKTKVVILGQDPYHGEGEANGLCFSVNNGVKIPPSLRNIFKELKSDIGIERYNTDLSDWAKEGILLLNTILTVEKDKPFSHANIGWEKFTDAIIKKLNEKNEQVIFVLWGNAAQKKSNLITNNKHKIIMSAHPSPLSYKRGFENSKPFSKINNMLDDFKKIIW